jgi:signal transduction histidine kinase
MKKVLNDFLRRCGELATAFQKKYKVDLFFRTTVNISVLSAGFVLVCILAFALSFWIPTIAWYLFVGILLVALTVVVLLARIMLRPIRDSLHYQKLFISNIAHELRTPLSTIKTTTEVALLSEKLPPSSKKLHTDILHELDRISSIINNLLSLNTLNRPERIEFEKVDLGPLLDAVAQQLSSLARERGIEMILKKDHYRIVWGNATALEQIMTNLIKNAISYTLKGVDGVVTVSIKPDYNGSIVFSVADNGIGIARDDLFHIFEPFYRVDTSRVRNIRKIGSGLGLTIVNELVRVHQGRIHIQSTLRKGTIVSIFLPSVVEIHDAGVSKGDERQGGSEIAVDFSGKQRARV